MYSYPPGMPDPQSPANAVTVMMGSPAYPSIRGTVRFMQTTGGVMVRAEISGLPVTPAGFFGFHLHTGNCSRPAALPPVPPGAPLPGDYYFPSADGHFNPSNMPHPRHAGDFPALLETSRGTAQLSFLTDRFTVMQAIGHAVIIHQNQDDFTTQPSGNSGPMIACGMVMPDRSQY
jgi:superoxide dismutase, Cu-Zn family